MRLEGVDISSPEVFLGGLAGMSDSPTRVIKDFTATASASDPPRQCTAMTTCTTRVYDDNHNDVTETHSAFETRVRDQDRCYDSPVIRHDAQMLRDTSITYIWDSSSLFEPRYLHQELH